MLVVILALLVVSCALKVAPSPLRRFKIITESALSDIFNVARRGGTNE